MYTWHDRWQWQDCADALFSGEVVGLFTQQSIAVKMTIYEDDDNDGKQ